MLTLGGKPLQVPILQGGMGVGVSLGGLAGAVAACGGMGCISTADAGYREPDFARDPASANHRALTAEIRKAKQIANGAGMVAINAMVATQDYAAAIRTAVEAGVDAVVSGAGLPLELPGLVNTMEVAIAPIVSSGRAAKLILRRWAKGFDRTADFVVIEGCKAGGHLGFHREQLEIFTDETYAQEVKKILTVVREIEADSHKNIPVVLAGGIYDRADMDRALALGVDGVQMGTRFVTAKESIVHENYKQKVIKAKDIDSEVTGMSTGHPIRVLRNKMTRQYLKLEKEGAPFEELEKMTLGALRKAVVDGDTVYGSVMAGQSAGLVKKEETCKEIIEDVVGLNK